MICLMQDFLSLYILLPQAHDTPSRFRNGVEWRLLSITSSSLIFVICFPFCRDDDTTASGHETLITCNFMFCLSFWRQSQGQSEGAQGGCTEVRLVHREVRQQHDKRNLVIHKGKQLFPLKTFTLI